MAIAERIPCVLAIAAVSTGPKASPKLPDRVNYPRNVQMGLVSPKLSARAVPVLVLPTRILVMYQRVAYLQKC